jgi:hypothetical protein
MGEVNINTLNIYQLQFVTLNIAKCVILLNGYITRMFQRTLYKIVLNCVFTLHI